MKALPIRVRFALHAALLTGAASLVSLVLIRPVIFRHQITQLDSTLQEDANIILAALETHGGTKINFRKPIDVKFIPPALANGYLQLRGPEGQELFSSESLATSDLTSTLEGNASLVIAGQPIRMNTQKHGFLTIHVGTDLDSLSQMQEDLTYVLLWFTPTSAVLVFLLGWIVGGRALQPISDLTLTAEKIDSAAAHAHLPLPETKDELYRLTEVLNSSFERLQSARAASERFSADASHQMKTPLAILRVGLERLRTQPLPEEAVLEVEKLEKQAHKLTCLTQDLLLLAQADAGRIQLELEAVDLSAAVAELAEDLDVYCEAHETSLDLELAPALVVRGDPRRIAVILQNLGENAAKYVLSNGSIKLASFHTQTHAIVRIGNASEPISTEVRESLFQRFKRGDLAAPGGHGLGLNIARSLAKAMGGELRLLDPVADVNWTEFELTLPLHTPA